MRNWYSITAQTDDEPQPFADVHIFDEIGFWGVTAKQFINDLKQLDVQQINLHIDSPGGSVFDGVAIQNSLKHHQARVTTYIDGLAGSIASIIALAGDEIKIADNAYVMIHNPASMVWGEAKDLLKEAEVLNKIADGLAGDYSRKMNISLAEARALMDEETWYLGQEAVDAGFADSTFSGSQVAASYDVKRFSNKAPQAVLQRFQKSPESARLTLKENHVADSKHTNTATAESADATTDVQQVETPTVEAPSTPAAETVEAAVDVDQAVQAALTKERQRIAQLTALGSKFNFTADCEQFIANGKSVDEFRAHILNKSPDDWKASLAIRNPAQQEASSNEADAANQAIAQIKARRQGK